LFQADIGELVWQVFNIGEQVVDIDVESEMKMKNPQYGGPPDTSLDFWAYALGICSVCGNDIWAQVNVRSKRFESIIIIDKAPEDIYGWGLLPEKPV
jgi:hypothetical protein